MSWHYRAPASFPAAFHNILRQAAAELGTPMVLNSSVSRANLEMIAQQFRWFKWCCVQKDDVPELAGILANHQIRASIEKDEAGYMLFITAKEDKISAFIHHNPELAGEILPQCQ